MLKPLNRKNNADKGSCHVVDATPPTRSGVLQKLVQKISPGKQGTLELSNCG